MCTQPSNFVTVIQRLNYLMPLKKHSRSSANGLREKGAAVRTVGHWWDYCPMQLSNEKERDQSFLTTGARLPFLILVVSEEFLRLKFKTRTNRDARGYVDMYIYSQSHTHTYKLVRTC